MNDIKAWKEVHRHLISSILLTKESINAEKAKRRFLLEELYNNVTEDGTSRWVVKSPQPKKTATRKRKSPMSGGIVGKTTSSSPLKITPKKKRIAKATSEERRDITAKREEKKLQYEPTFTTTTKMESAEQLSQTDHLCTSENDYHNETISENQKKEELLSSSLIQNLPSAQNQSPQTNDNLFNYPMSYDILDTNAIDVAAAVASALTVQSLSSSTTLLNTDNNTSSNPTFDTNDDLYTSQSGDAFMQNHFQQVYQNQDNDDYYVDNDGGDFDEGGDDGGDFDEGGDDDDDDDLPF